MEIAPVYIPVLLSQKPSAENGIIRPAILFLAWLPLNCLYNSAVQRNYQDTVQTLRQQYAKRNYQDTETIRSTFLSFLYAMHARHVPY